MKAYKEGILLGGDKQQSTEQIAEDYIDTIESNISLFLKDKINKMIFRLDNPENDFENFWNKISAEGNLKSALKEWEINYNAS